MKYGQCSNDGCLAKTDCSIAGVLESEFTKRFKDLSDEVGVFIRREFWPKVSKRKYLRRDGGCFAQVVGEGLETAF